MSFDNFEVAKQLFTEGLTLLESGHLEEAESRFLESLKFAPDRASILTNLSATQIKLRKFDDAKTSAKKLLSLDSSSVQAWFNLGVSELELTNQEQAIFALKKVVELQKDSIEALLLLAQIYDVNNDPITAIKYFKDILQFAPNHFDSFLSIGSILNDLSQFEDALNYHEKALQINPEHHQTLFNSGLALIGLGKYEPALLMMRKVVELDTGNLDAWVNKSLIHHRLGQYSEALISADCALSLDSGIAALWSNRCIMLTELKRYDEALISADRALLVDSGMAQAHYNRGNVLKNLMRLTDAITSYDRAIEINANFIDAHNNRGLTLKELGHLNHALQSFEQIIAINAYHSEAYVNLSNVLQDLGRFNEALAGYDKALSLSPDYAEAYSNKGATLNELKRYEEAIAQYDKALSLRPDYVEAWANKGVALHQLKRFDEAVAHYDKVLSLKPNDPEAWSNKGSVLQDLKHFDEAIAHYDQALSLKPDYAEAWFNKGNTLQHLKRFDEVVAHYDKAFSLKSDIDWLYGDLLHNKMKICDWSGLENALGDVAKRVAENKKAMIPFPLLSLIDNPSLHRRCAEIFVQKRFPPHFSLDPISKRPRKEKIRIGYFSADFKNHPVALLTAELFELHDRQRFEVFAFSLQTAHAEDAVNLRLRKGFDQFIEVDNMPDQEVAALARESEIDIAIDLTGFTQDSRTGIFSYRAAPIQASYIGYLGTMGAGYFDYLFSDKTIIPEGTQLHYSEKITYLPSYQVNDSKRVISDRQFTRQELGLPEKGFVFCCFNNNFKILPATFDGWMRILKSVDDSVLFLYAENQWAKENLKKETQARGIDSSRLVFGERIPNELYLARYKACDLFLDTNPYNAGTTASDALWTGLPLLTLVGQSFASRVAASLLNAIGLPELITNTQEAYEALAIELAMNPKKLADIRLKLANNRLTTPLFDTPLFTKHIEAAYIKMYERYQADLEPEHISIV